MVTRETALTYLVFQKEVGAENQTPHLQGYLQMERKVCIKSVTKYLQKILGTLVRTFKTMGTSEEASVYCKKMTPVILVPKHLNGRVNSP